MRADIVSIYRGWLRDLAGITNPSYDSFVDIAWLIKFKYFVPNDENRAMDGVALRLEFEMETSSKLPNIGECTMLEMLIGLSGRVNDFIYDPTHPDRIPYWFHRICENAEAFDYPTLAFKRINDRLYGPSGAKGLFPLKRSDEDQREVEIWYQMMSWFAENSDEFGFE